MCIYNEYSIKIPRTITLIVLFFRDLNNERSTYNVRMCICLLNRQQEQLRRKGRMIYPELALHGIEDRLK